MEIWLRFEMPFKDDLFYDFIVIILTVVGVFEAAYALACHWVCLRVDLFLCT